jgi:hypothetical protein
MRLAQFAIGQIVFYTYRNETLYFQSQILTLAALNASFVSVAHVLNY